MIAQPSNPLTLDQLMMCMGHDVCSIRGAGVSIEVMDGPQADHHLKVVQVIRRFVPDATITYTNIVCPSNHCKTLKKAELRLREILESDRKPNIINNSWEFPRVPTDKECKRNWHAEFPSPIDLTYDQERILYPCHPGHPYTSLVREATRRGIIMVFAAGNRGLDQGDHLFSGRISGANGLAEVVTVGACDQSGNRQPSSSYGPSTFAQNKPDLLAQSDYWINDELGTFTGTSSSAALVTGIIAQIIGSGELFSSNADLLKSIKLREPRVLYTRREYQ